MTDVLIRHLSPADLHRIDERAARLGLSRGEYLRRRISADAARDDGPVGVEDFKRVGRRNRDLLDETVMRDAWS